MRLLSRHKRKYRDDLARVAARRAQWGPFIITLNSVFEEVSRVYKADQFFDNLYCEDGKSVSTERRVNQESASIFFGNHPTGIVVKKLAQVDSPASSEVLTERGASLLFSQAPNGAVFCLMQAAQSALIERKRKNFLYRVYACPCDITRKEIESAIDVLFWYNRATSFFRHFNLWDTVKEDAYRIRSLTYDWDWNIAIGIGGMMAGVIGAIFAALAYFHPLDKHSQPPDPSPITRSIAPPGLHP
jgi:hypothetical protein